MLSKIDNIPVAIGLFADIVYFVLAEYLSTPILYIGQVVDENR
jgi:hypothetical protein